MTGNWFFLCSTKHLLCHADLQQSRIHVIAFIFFIAIFCSHFLYFQCVYILIFLKGDQLFMGISAFVMAFQREHNFLDCIIFFKKFPFIFSFVLISQLLKNMRELFVFFLSFEYTSSPFSFPILIGYSVFFFRHLHLGLCICDVKKR